MEGLSIFTYDFHLNLPSLVGSSASWLLVFSGPAWFLVCQDPCRSVSHLASVCFWFWFRAEAIFLLFFAVLIGSGRCFYLDCVSLTILIDRLTSPAVDTPLPVFERFVSPPYSPSWACKPYLPTTSPCRTICLHYTYLPGCPGQFFTETPWSAQLFQSWRFIKHCTFTIWTVQDEMMHVCLGRVLRNINLTAFAMWDMWTRLCVVSPSIHHCLLFPSWLHSEQLIIAAHSSLIVWQNFNSPLISEHTHTHTQKLYYSLRDVPSGEDIWMDI